MAEYCSRCSPFENEFDINLFRIALNLKKGYSETFLCEGCSNRGIYKDDTGRLYLAKSVEGEIVLKSINIEELLNTNDND